MWTEDRLNELLTTPTDKLVEDIKKLSGDIMILGAGGKMGPDMPMWAMMQNFNLETLMTMMDNAPESAIKALNKQLNQFDLVD